MEATKHLYSKGKLLYFKSSYIVSSKQFCTMEHFIKNILRIVQKPTTAKNFIKTLWE